LSLRGLREFRRGIRGYGSRRSSEAERRSAVAMQQFRGSGVYRAVGEPVASPIHVLVIEDDAANSEVICHHLAEHGYRCTTAGTAEEASAMLARFRIDLVIADLALPGATNGAEFAHAARRNGIPAMIVTGHAHRESDPEIPVLQKPLRISDLLDMVEELLARPRPAPASP
jgi:CheY-like chemotaxis protein